VPQATFMGAASLVNASGRSARCGGVLLPSTRARAAERRSVPRLNLLKLGRYLLHRETPRQCAVA
jgi:hypothetical protein